MGHRRILRRLQLKAASGSSRIQPHPHLEKGHMESPSSVSSSRAVHGAVHVSSRHHVHHNSTIPSSSAIMALVGGNLTSCSSSWISPTTGFVSGPMSRSDSLHSRAAQVSGSVRRAPSVHPTDGVVTWGAPYEAWHYAPPPATMEHGIGAAADADSAELSLVSWN